MSFVCKTEFLTVIGLTWVQPAQSVILSHLFADADGRFSDIYLIMNTLYQGFFQLKYAPKSSCLILLFSFFLLQACSQELPISKISGPTMGTEYHISWVTEVSSESERSAESIDVQSQIDEILRTLNKSMSTYDPESELSLLNTNSPSDWQQISEHLFRVLAMSESIHQRSHGAFDVTVGPLVNLWGFGPNKHLKKVPDVNEVNALLANIGAEAIKLREIVSSQSDGIKKFEVNVASKRYIDLSAIAKGYAVDVLGEYLEGRGINRYLVEVGGEILARGVKAKDTPWRIAIEAPTDNTRTAQIIIPLSDVGIATSGDYRNFFKQDGKRFSHTIDGRSGYPVTHGLASVTVLHKSVAIADAWATALTVLGAEEGLKVAQQQGLLAFFIQRDDNGFKQSMTSQFKQLELMGSHDVKNSKER